MRQIAADESLVACCGLYCGCCGSYLKEKCPGCRDNAKAGWCGVRKCCIEKKIRSCADCGEYADVAACGKFNNVFSKAFGLLFRSDRRGCVNLIRGRGYRAYAGKMAADKAHTIRK